ncbi:MAG: hypothetical protein IRY95_00370, partial [Clostridia bacterium]|nr:hypothetical protein [Clostridia bacterium]
AVYYRGERVADVTTPPALRKAVETAARDYAMALDPAWRHLTEVTRPDGTVLSRYYHVPRSAEDLLLRSRLIEESTRLCGTVVPLIHEIGSDALFALLHVSRQVDAACGTDYARRVEAFYRHCADGDLAVAVAQTDVKGDRGREPSQQDPDYYLRIVERRRDGIVVRGAKAHTSVSVNANEVIVLPTRAMREAGADCAVAFAVPVATPGLKLIASPYFSEGRNAFERPLSARFKMEETLTVFDDVFVPAERVFLAGEWAFAGELARRFVQFHRFTAVSYKLPLVDLLAGAAHLVAEMNGILGKGHVREKLTALATYAGTVRALTEAAAYRGRPEESGVFFPDEATVNLAKFYFAHHYHQALRDVQDLAGGLLVTGPGLDDLENPETGPYVRRYLGTGRASAEDRLRVINLIADLTAGELGGYHAVLAVHAEGSIEAEKLMIHRNYDFAGAAADGSAARRRRQEAGRSPAAASTLSLWTGVSRSLVWPELFQK